MIWLLYFPLMMIIMVVCYITNPIVVLFSNEEGELPGFLKYWQTWDDSLDSMFFMTEVVPKSFPILDYNWANKYEHYQDKETLKEYNKIIDKSRLKPGAVFSIKERIQRYFCRTLWLTRNCAYGFAYYMFNVSGNIKDLHIEEENIDKTGEKRFAYDPTQSILVRPWTYKFYTHIFGNFYISGYLGWKIPLWQKNGKYNAMIANRIIPEFGPPE